MSLELRGGRMDLGPNCFLLRKARRVRSSQLIVLCLFVLDIRRAQILYGICQESLFVEVQVLPTFLVEIVVPIEN